MNFIRSDGRLFLTYILLTFFTKIVFMRLSPDHTINGRCAVFACLIYMSQIPLMEY